MSSMGRVHVAQKLPLKVLDVKESEIALAAPSFLNDGIVQYYFVLPLVI